MTILNELKRASIEARKSKSSTSAFLVTLYSEAAMVGKTKANRESTDEEALSVIRKFKAGAEEVLSILKERVAADASLQSTIDTALQEIEILNNYLPVLYSEAELIPIIKSYIDSGLSTVGPIMSKLKAEHKGKFCGSMAHRLIIQLQ